jgi:hypothetical protein
MVFKGLKDKFKHKSGTKYLQQELKRPPVALSRSPGIQSLGIIADLEAFREDDRFFDLVEDLGLKSNTVKIIGYREYYDKNSPYATPVFSDKDLGWKGAIENSYALEFLSRDYDVLINYYDQPRLLLHLMSVKTRAALRIGFAGVDPAYNDLILQSPLSDFETFRVEVKKYLVLLKQLS